MRRWVWAFFALSAALFLFLIFQSASQEGEAKLPLAESKGAQATVENRTEPVVLAIRSAWLADSGGKKVALMQLYVSPADGSGNLSVLCSPRPMQKNILLLSHPSAPGVSPALPSLIARRLSSCGLSSREAGLEEALGSKNSVIVLPTGALPAAFSGKEEMMAESNNHVILIESLPGRVISEEGGIYQSDSRHGFLTVRLEPKSEGEAASRAASLVLMPSSPALQLRPSSALMAVATEMEGSTAYCRVLYLSPSGCRFADTSQLSSLPGTIKGPAKLTAGSQQAFEFSLQNNSEGGRFLRFFAVAYRDAQELWKQEIAGGKVQGEWASTFLFGSDAWGQHIIKVVDQFGRLHAIAYVQVLGLEVHPVSQEGSRFEFSAYFGGEPANGAVQVWLDSGEKKEYYAYNGTLVVWAAPSSGNHTMHFYHKGAKATYSFHYKGGGIFEYYLRSGLPAILFLFAVLFLLRARKKEKYTIKFPAIADMERQTEKVSPKQVENAYILADRQLGSHSLPAYPEEIARFLPQAAGWKKGLEADAGSLLSLLRELAARGEFLECGGAFIPRGKAGEFSPAELSALRLIHDVLLERGIAFKRSRVVKLDGGLEIQMFSRKKPISLAGKVRRTILVFPSQEERREFERSLKTPTRQNTAIKLTISNGRLVLALASRSELEYLLG